MNENVTIRSLYASVDRPGETDGWLVAIHAVAILLLAVTLVNMGYAIGTGKDVASACLMVIVGLGVATFMTWALHSRAAKAMTRTTIGGVDDSEVQFRDLLKRS